MYDDGGGCSGKDADVSKKIQRQAWGGLDLTVRWTNQLLLYSTLCFLILYNQIVVLLLASDSCDNR